MVASEKKEIKENYKQRPYF